jgi:glycosyltransferase involved in cell wall biosynthesis
LKRRIAIWIHGGVGGGNFSQGQPVLNKIIESLKMDFEIIIYSQLGPNPEFIAHGFILNTAPRIVKSMWLRWLYLAVLFAYRHIKNPHQLIYAFWGYPAGIIAVFLGKLFKKPSIIHLQGGDSVSIPELRYGTFYSPFSKKLSCWAYNKATLVIALTQFQKINLKKHGIKRQVEIIPYGPDLTMFKFNGDKFQKGITRFIHIGNHTLIKDQMTLLKTFRIISNNIKNSRLTVIGHDALNGTLKKNAIQFGIENVVEFLGPVPYSEIPHYLDEADVILHTSLYEGQATVISEAAACGVLLAGTRVGLLSDLGDNYGLIADVGDADSLAEKVLKVLEDKNLVIAYIARSRKWAEKYDHQWTTNSIKFLINSLIRQ